MTGLEKGIQNTLKRIYVSLSEARVHIHTYTHKHTRPCKAYMEDFSPLALA